MKEFRSNEKHNGKTAMMWIIFLVFGLMGCSGVYGQFVHDEAVDQAFEDLSILPNHRYYYSGSDTYPRTIIAIDETYTLSSKIWRPVDMTEDQLKRWIYYPPRTTHLYPYTLGRYITDDKGHRIGVWYSSEDWLEYAVVRMIDETTVQISTPISERHRKYYFSR